MSLWPTICWCSSCGGLPSAGTIQPRCCPHGCFLRVIIASNPEVRCGPTPMRNLSARGRRRGLTGFLLAPPPTFPETRARSAPFLRRPRVLAHVPVLLPATPGVTLRRVRQLLVRKHRALQSQEGAQSTLKVIGRDDHVPFPCSVCEVRKCSGSRRLCNAR